MSIKELTISNHAPYLQKKVRVFSSFSITQKVLVTHTTLYRYKRLEIALSDSLSKLHHEMELPYVQSYWY